MAGRRPWDKGQAEVGLWAFPLWPEAGCGQGPAGGPRGERSPPHAHQRLTEHWGSALHLRPLPRWPSCFSAAGHSDLSHTSPAGPGRELRTSPGPAGLRLPVVGARLRRPAPSLGHWVPRSRCVCGSVPGPVQQISFIFLFTYALQSQQQK